MKKPSLNKLKNTASSAKKEIKRVKKVFPKNPRVIPDVKLSHPGKNSFIFVICFICGLILVAIVAAEYELNLSYNSLQIVQKQHETVIDEIATWQKVVAKYPGYRDGYFHLAVLEYQIGDREAAKTYNQQALSLDPNFSNGRELEKKLE